MEPSAIAITPNDLGSGWLEKVIAGGDRVAGQVTLDLCGGGYASEALRVARLQVALKNGPTVMSNEVVEYASGGAEEAYQELKQRVADCPSKPVALPEQGAPRVLFKLTPIRARANWAARTVAVQVTATARGRSQTSLAVYQFVGNWMSAIYSYASSPTSVAAVERAAGIAAEKLNSNASGGISA